MSSHGYDEPLKVDIVVRGENNIVEGHKKIVTLSGNKTEILEYDVSLNELSKILSLFL